MLSFRDYAAHDAMGLMELVRRHEVSAAELRTTALAAIAALNPVLNAVIAHAAADAAETPDHRPVAAPFAGLPFLVKEGHGTKGQPAVMASRLAEGLRCEEDGEFVQRLRGAGVEILGSTNTPEFGNAPTTESLLHGPARNPWNPEHMTGGSSGGSAAAVAAGLVPVAESSDGGGSIRTPAHCCGVFGLKPTRGRTPVGPKSNGGVFGLGAVHVISRSVRDSAAFLDIVQGSEPGALYRIGAPARPFLQEVGADPGRLRIAFSAASPSGVPTHPACVAAVQTAALLCHDLGHEVEESAPAYDWAQFRTAFVDMWSVPLPFAVSLLEAATGRKAEPGTLESANLATLEHGRRLTAEQIGRSNALLYAIARIVERFFDRWDVLITPVDLTPAPRLGVIAANQPHRSLLDWFDMAISRFAAFPPIFNVTGQPAMSLPLAMSDDGLPVGVQCAARVGDEATLFRLAAQIEASLPWAQRIPRIHVSRLES
jgi:amidase